MSPEVAKLAFRAVIDYLDGDINKYLNLTHKAMRYNGEITCHNCGGVQIPCRVGYKGNWKHGYICLGCGQIMIDRKLYRQCHNPKRRTLM